MYYNGCELCEDSREVVVRPDRVMGATYWGSDSGDEHLEPCPLCTTRSLLDHFVEVFHERMCG